MDANLETLSISGASSAPAQDEVLNTPEHSDTGSQEEDADDIVASWDLAIEQCRTSLSEYDFEKLQTFPTPEKLLSDLKKKETGRSSLLHVRRPIRTMKSFLTFFVVTMSPRTLRSSIFWGLVYLLVDTSEGQRQMNNRWNDTVDMLEKVTRSLDACKRAHTGTPFDEDMKLALNDAFIALITLWAESVGFMRANPYVLQDPDGVQYRFDRAIKKVDESFSYLKLCAATKESDSSRRAASVPRATPLKSLLPDDLVQPCGGAPHYKDETFYGRQSELEEMDLVLSPGAHNAHKFFTICGLGGVGKSKLALAYAKRYGHQFSIALWIKAQTAVSIGQSFTDIAVELRLPGAKLNGNVDDNRRLIFDFLKQYDGSWLIVWDNVETQALIRPYLSSNSTSASMLVTTRYPEEASYFRSRGSVLNLQKFSLADSRDLFAQLLGPGYLHADDAAETEAAGLLLQKLDGLAIGISTMATRILSKAQSIHSFLKRYRNGKHTSVQGELADYDLTLETLWNESFATLREEQNKGQASSFSLLGALSFCSPDRIPRELFVGRQLDSLREAPTFCHDRDEYEDAMDSLRKHGLIDADKDFGAVSIHRLVQSALLKFLDQESIQTMFNLAVCLVHRAFPKQIEGRPLHLQWDDCRVFIQHGTWLAGAYAESLSLGQTLHPPPEFSELLSNCIWYLVEIGEHSECHRISDIALQSIDTETYLYGHLHNSLFAMTWFQNDLRKCRIHSDVAVASIKAHREETSEEYVGILSNKANLLASEGNDEAALRLYLGVEQTRKQSKHPENIALAFVYLGIGRLRCRMGDFEDAESRFTAAREIISSVHGARGQYMQHVHYDLGNLETIRKRFGAAEEHYRIGQGLQEEENKEHIFIASFLYKRACIATAKGALGSASQLLEKAVTQAVQQGSEGEEARALRKLCEVRLLEGSLQDDPRVDDLRTRASYLKSHVEDELGITQAEGASEAEQFDKLVCVIYR